MNLNSVLSELRSEQKHLAHQQTKLKKTIRALRGLNRNNSHHPSRTISKAGRARIAAAQRARWAKVKRAKKS